MITKVVIIVEAPFGQRDYIRYGIEIIKKNGFDVVVWNLTPLLHHSAYVNIQLPDPIVSDDIIYFHTQCEFQSAIGNLEESAFIYTTLVLSSATHPVFKSISQSNIPYCVTSLNAVPSFGKTHSIPLWERVKNITWKKIIIKLFSSVSTKLLGIRKASMVAVLGNKTDFNRPEVGEETRIVYTQSVDYDRYLEANLSSEQLPSGIVFLDNYLPYHTDSIYSGETSPVSAVTYHDSLNRLFAFLENKTGKKVIIAAHPKANYASEGNPFNGRMIITGKTAELVKVADLVVLNFSTSFNFAVLYNKPVVFFTSNDLEKVELYRTHIKGMANLFNKQPLNIDEEFKMKEDQLYKVEYEKYKEYKNGFIKLDGTPEIPVWQIMCDAFKTFKEK